MKEFNGIFSFINSRKKLLAKYYKKQNELMDIEKKLKSIDMPDKIDIEEYKAFFKEYYISFNEDKEKYFLKEIKASKDEEGNIFYDVIYQYMRFDEFGKMNENHEGMLNFRKLIHLIIDDGGKLKKVKHDKDKKSN